MDAARYDVVVLGQGAAAIGAAAEAAALGARVAWIKEGAPETSAPETDRAVEWLEEWGIDVYVGRAVFTGRDALEIDGQPLAFRKAILACGTRPAPVPSEEVDPACHRAPESLRGAEPLPRRLAILGVGVCECQWAQQFARRGCGVSLLGRPPTILPGEDPEAWALIERQMEQDGIHLVLGCHELSVDRTGNQCVVLIEKAGQREERFFDQVLVEMPERPNTDGLGLEAAGIAVHERGVSADAYLSTTNPRVLAAGPVCGEECSAPEVAEAMGRLAAQNALRLLRRKFDPRQVPRYVSTHPAIARVGLTAAEAAAQDSIRTYRAELSSTSEGASSVEPGFVIAHTDRATGRVLGAQVVAEKADEILFPLLLLTARRLPLAALADVLPFRPSRFEILAHLGDLARREPRPNWWKRWTEKPRQWWQSLTGNKPAESERAEAEMDDQW